MEFSLSAGVPILERTPATLTALLDGLPDDWTDATEGPDTWSPTDVVAHLLHADRTNWMPRARVILEHGRAVPLPSFDQAGHRRLARIALREQLAGFREARAESLATLASWKLGPDSLALEGEHPALGLVTLGQLLAAWVAHDLAHMAQVNRVLAKQYREAVGPWRTYLPILDR